MSSRDQQFTLFSNLNGGLSTRPAPLVIEGGSSKKMLSPSLLNCDFFPTGAIAKRLGLTQQGNTIVSSTYASQTTETGTLTIAGTGGGTVGIAQKITTVGAASIQSVTHKLSATFGLNATVSISVQTDSGGSPSGVEVGASQSYDLTNTATPYTQAFNFPTPAALSGTTDYWFVVLFDFQGATSPTAYFKGVASGALVKTDAAYNAGPWVSQTFNGYYILISSGASSAVQGLYDYRFGSASTQKQMAAMGGALYWNNSGTWTSLVTGLGSGQNNLWSFSTLKDYLFTMDNGNNPGRVWNGSAAYTTKLGFQATFSAADSAGGGTVANGTYKIMAVTTLTSGGYRASAIATVTVASGGTGKIAVTSVVMDGTGATDFGFDIGSTATKWFMTPLNDTVYRLIPTANLSTAANPMANSVTSFNITAMTGISSANTLLDEYGLEQSYFTTQLASPTGKYLQVFQNMMALSGDATYPSRVWFSGIADGTNLAGPQIWGTAGGVYGNYRDLDNQDGEVITGLKEWNGSLYAFKRHSVHVIAFTGVSGNPFEVRRLSGNLGALSHWSIKETQRGLVFISERGPCICTGTMVSLIPSAKNILDRFNPADSTAYNLAAMQYTTAGNNSTKMQIHWGVSSTNATTRDLTLVYDYENDCFWENSVSANYYAEITDSNFFPSVWSGNYSAQVFKHDDGTDDNGSTISWYFETPDLTLGKPFNYKVVDHLFVSGTVQNSGTLNVEVFTDFSNTVAATQTFNMADSNFKRGLSVPLNLLCQTIRFKFSNAELDVPVQIDSIGIGWDNKGMRV